MAYAKKKPAKKNWANYKPKPKVNVSRHDHVGHMIFTEEDCACRECGQAWERTQYGWKPVAV